MDSSLSNAFADFGAVMQERMKQEQTQGGLLGAMMDPKTGNVDPKRHPLLQQKPPQLGVLPVLQQQQQLTKPQPVPTQTLIDSIRSQAMYPLGSNVGN
jgi:hypothetical protein